MNDFIITTWHDMQKCWMVVKLSRGDQSVECYVTDEVLVTSERRAVMQETMKMLGEAWQRKYGSQVIIRPPVAEAHPWTAHDGDYIDGEVIEEERRAIDAPRKAIEGRRH